MKDLNNFPHKVYTKCSQLIVKIRIKQNPGAMKL